MTNIDKKIIITKNNKNNNNENFNCIKIISKNILIFIRKLLIMFIINMNLEIEIMKKLKIKLYYLIKQIKFKKVVKVVLIT